MELEELEQRLGPFVRSEYEDRHARVSDVHKMPGHAGFSYGFAVESRGRREAWFLRLPPPGAKWEGTADVLRQAAVLRALAGTGVPHCPVKWAGDDLQWFGRPYFVVPQLEGDVARLEAGEWAAELPAETRYDMARQAMAALAEIHRLDWKPLVAALGEPIPFDRDVLRWDRFEKKLARPEDFARAPVVRELLLDRRPQEATVGVFHGDYQFGNLFFSFAGQLRAVIDWELTGIGATLNDLGWIATFNDAAAWHGPGLPGPTGAMPPAEELCALYETAWGEKLPDLRWFRSLAAYKFAIITGFNLYLHRRGRRPDPMWEDVGDSIESLMARAEALLS